MVFNDVPRSPAILSNNNYDCRWRCVGPSNVCRPHQWKELNWTLMSLEVVKIDGHMRVQFRRRFSVATPLPAILRMDECKCGNYLERQIKFPLFGANWFRCNRVRAHIYNSHYNLVNFRNYHQVILRKLCTILSRITIHVRTHSNEAKPTFPTMCEFFFFLSLSSIQFTWIFGIWYRWRGSWIWEIRRHIVYSIVRIIFRE